MTYIVRNKTDEERSFRARRGVVVVPPHGMVDALPPDAREAIASEPDVWERVYPGDPEYIAGKEQRE